MDNIMSERLENLHQGLKQLHDHNLEGRLAIIKELQNAPEAFSSAMAERLTPSLDSLNTAVEELRRQREESSTDAIQRLVEEFHELNFRVNYCSNLRNLRKLFAVPAQVWRHYPSS